MKDKKSIENSVEDFLKEEGLIGDCDEYANHLMSEVGDYSYREAKDRAFIALSTLENALAQHPIIMTNREAKEKYDRSVAELSDLHELLSRLSGPTQR